MVLRQIQDRRNGWRECFGQGQLEARQPEIEQQAVDRGKPGGRGDGRVYRISFKVEDEGARPAPAEVKISRDGEPIDRRTVTPGQQVITAGQFKVQPGTLVTTAIASSEQTQAKVAKE